MSNTNRPTKHATRRPAGVQPPAHWTDSEPPAPDTLDTPETTDPLGINPVRYGDWERNGIAIDF